MFRSGRVVLPDSSSLVHSSKIKSNIGDLNSADVYGNPISVSTNIEKAEVLGNFFSSVFTVEKELNNSSIPFKPCHYPITQLIFNEQLILDKINKLNINKSPGPDGLHPRILLWIMR